MFEIIPSLASANQASLRDEIAKLKGIGKLHMDIEDGNFVPNITFGIKTVRDISKITDLELDVHLMVTNPDSYIFQMSTVGVKAVAVNFETMPYPMHTINMIRALNMRPGLALNPRTSYREVKYLLNSVDYILVLTAESDMRGQMFQPALIDKIVALRRIKPEHLKIWADGGIGAKELRSVVKAGAETIIMGRAVFNAANPFEFVSELMRDDEIIRGE